MNRIVLFLSFFLSVGCLFASEGGNYSYRFWMISSEGEYANTYKFSYARICVDNTSDYLTLVDGTDPQDSTKWAPAVLSDSTQLGSPACWADISAYANQEDAYKYSFVIEIYNDSGMKVGRSSSVKFEELSQYVRSDQKTEVAVPFAQWNVVPEPTSGLLTLCGLAVLALRRKQGMSQCPQG